MITADSEVAQNDDIIMMREVAHRERTHARKMRAFFRYADHSKDHATWMQERYIELLKPRYHKCLTNCCSQSFHSIHSFQLHVRPFLPGCKAL